ncbi:homoserine kinase [Oceanobacillus manasiensis]|uniref:homoserine kinase n=1 Tax=Oceanobacillus manasiensis TaxID=586413 RepID=UPI0005A7A68F|nr:homoserine kinase [Oceanobacillus manasiensis]
MTAFQISVPASSANLGPAFDSAGIALNLYLILEVEEQRNWEFIHASDLLPTITTYEEHYIYQIAKQTADRFGVVLSPCRVTVTSEIPLARGLGSSAAAVIAGIELANQLCDLKLTNADILKFGTELEGHPDNIAASLLGGLIISTLQEDVHYVQLPLSELEAVLSIPPFELMTEDARNVLPATFTRNQASMASSLSNVLIAALATGDFTVAGEMMEKDLFHEPYRAGLLPHYKQIKQEAKLAGSYGTVISGAGPTMISFTQKGTGTTLAKHLQKLLSDFQVKVAEIDQQGMQTKTLRPATD